MGRVLSLCALVVLVAVFVWPALVWWLVGAFGVCALTLLSSSGGPSDE